MLSIVLLLTLTQFLVGVPIEHVTVYFVFWLNLFFSKLFAAQGMNLVAALRCESALVAIRLSPFKTMLTTSRLVSDGYFFVVVFFFAIF